MKRNLAIVIIIVTVLFTGVGIIYYCTVRNQSDENTKIASQMDALKQRNETEIAELRKEISKLEGVIKRLDQTIFALTLKNPPLPANAQNEVTNEWTPEQILEAYFSVENWQERLALVYEPDNAKSKMAKDYANWGPSFRVTYYKVYPFEGSNVEIGEEITIRADVGAEIGLEYFLIKTEDGYRIRWLKSLREMERIDNPVLTVKVQGIGNDHSGNLEIDFAITNKSPNTHLSFSTLEFALFDQDDNCLNRTTFLQSLEPLAVRNKSITLQISDKAKVYRWEWSVLNLTANNGKTRIPNAQKYYTLQDCTAVETREKLIKSVQELEKFKNPILTTKVLAIENPTLETLKIVMSIKNEDPEALLSSCEFELVLYSHDGTYLGKKTKYVFGLEPRGISYETLLYDRIRVNQVHSWKWNLQSVRVEDDKRLVPNAEKFFTILEQE